MIKVASLFSQLLHHFPRTEFAHLVTKHGAEHRAKGFTCWTQLVAMLFCHLAHADSLREICGGLACCQGMLRHLGIGSAPNKSTLSYANKHRPASLYEDLFWTMLQRFRNSGSLGNRKRKFRFKNKLLSLYSTTISLCLCLFPWAQYRAYNDYKLFSYWTANKVFFVTRQKENAVYEVVEERRLPQNRSILKDQIIKLTGVDAEKKCPHLPHRIVVWIR